MAASRDEIQRFMDGLEPIIARSFRDALSQIKTRAQITALTEAIRANNMTAVMNALGLRPGSWAGISEAVRNAYIESGAFMIAADVPRRLGMVFDVLNPRAEQWLRGHSSEFITYISNEQRETVQELLRQSMAAGRNPRSTALDIVGRMSSQTRRREGGILGLNKPQAAAALRAREQLANLDSAYFQRTLRDKRFDGIVRRSINSGMPLAQSDINRIVGRYEDRLLKLRGDTIGRTETLAALNEASDESLRQVVQEGLAPPDAVKRIWRHSFSQNERPGHIAMDGESRGIDEAFTNPVTGVSLIHPGEGPAGEVINCRCYIEHKIDFAMAEGLT